MKKNNYIFLMFIAALLNNCASDDQPIIGEEIILTDNVEVYNPNLVEDSYVLAIESGGTRATILDKLGNELLNWTFENSLGNDLEILPNGQLLGIFKSQNPSILFGGFGGLIKLLNPDGTTSWEFEHSSANYIAHHDVELLSNGNVLFLVWERITASEAQLNGVNTSVDIFPEALVEVNPNTNQIVWEWHSWDHIIQNFNATASNFGDLSLHPELININYNTSSNGDIMHANGIDLDEDRNVVFISVNKFSEIWVVDHSTSSSEAATNTGGTYGKGGNLLYRFGNPETYNNSFGQRLFYNNHFPNFLEDNVPGAGNLLVYVNGGNIDQSSVYELDLPEQFNLLPNINNEPPIVWSFTNEDLFFGRVSGAVRLHNGNTLICEGDYGFWEVTNSGEIAWKYRRPDSILSYWRCYSYLKDSNEILSLGIE